MKIQDFEGGLAFIQEALLIPDRDIVVVAAPLIQFRLLPRTTQISIRDSWIFAREDNPRGMVSPGLAGWLGLVDIVQIA